MSRVCEVWQLGEMDYAAALALQGRLAAARAAGAAPDRLVLLTHPHTFTLGSAARAEHLLWDAAERARRGVAVHRADRGGGVTYHGPGQLVAYPIVTLETRDPIGYARALEQVVIGALADFGVRARAVAGLTGVWVDTPSGPAKVCAIGARITARGVTKHGCALNVNADLSYFGGIVPCGIHSCGVTSLASLLGGTVEMDAVAARVVAHFGRVFGFEMRVTNPKSSLAAYQLPDLSQEMIL
ncbi:MAG: lipoyl(octanoyl) transferase LipB [Aggregatilineales bacterium]